MSGIAKKSAETFAVRLGMQAFSIVGGIVIARELGADGKGAFSYATTVLGTILIFFAGQSSAIAWQYGKRNVAARPVFLTAMKIFAAVALPLTLLLAAVGFFVAKQHLLYAVAAAVPFGMFMQIAAGFYLADSDVRSLNLQQVFPTALSAVIFIPLLIFAHAGLWVLLAVWSVMYACAAVYSAYRIWPLIRGRDRPARNSGLMREQLVYGLQVSLNSVVAYLNFRIDVFLVLFFLGQAQLGIYSIGIAIGELMFQLTRPINTSAFGRIARSGEAEAAELTAKCMRHSLALVLVFAVAVFFAAPRLVTLVYGAQFAAAGPVLRILLPGVIAYSMMPVLATFFSQQLGSPRIPLLFSGISTIICAGITIAAIPHLGIIGGAVATSTSYFISFVFATRYFSKRANIPLARIFCPTRADAMPYRRAAEYAVRLPLQLTARLSGR